MKLRQIILGITILLWAQPLWATSPAAIALKYDPQIKSLHIEVSHVAHDPRDHHIRKIQIFLNDNVPIDLYFATQTTPIQVVADVPLAAKEGDKIRVLAICNKAGRKEEILVVPSKDDIPSEQPKELPKPELKAKPKKKVSTSY